jgi:hypothetical protein
MILGSELPFRKLVPPFTVVVWSLIPIQPLLPGLSEFSQF